MCKYILAIDQSTQGTKGLLFNEFGKLLARSDRPHAQLIDARGWVEHDAEEIYRNTLIVVREVVEKANIDKSNIAALGISNQRETVAAWNRKTGRPICHAVVWQCARGTEICKRLDKGNFAETIKRATGLNLSPYFSASKLAWILENVKEAKTLCQTGDLCMGTMDSWLVYCLTNRQSFKTDFSNAARTQLFNISALQWDENLCRVFGVPSACLPEVCDSDACFGETDFDGWLSHKIPILGVLGDSNGALFGQGCLTPGMVKTTYGTGSSVMLNIGETPAWNRDVVTSLAWKRNGKIQYVLEGNINYTGAVITWLKDSLHLIPSCREVQQLAEAANPADTTYLVPAFTGLGAPYWDSTATALLTGMTRTTGRNEIVRAAENCIAYQIADVIHSMRRSGTPIHELRADGGPTQDHYLMQFQSDILDLPVRVSSTQEVSGMGVAFLAGIRAGLYDPDTIFQQISRKDYVSQMQPDCRCILYGGWKQAIQLSLLPTAAV